MMGRRERLMISGGLGIAITAVGFVMIVFGAGTGAKGLTGTLLMLPMLPGWTVADWIWGSWSVIHSGAIVCVPIFNAALWTLLVFGTWEFVTWRSSKSLGAPVQKLVR
jgi:hypothetical protein